MSDAPNVIADAWRNTLAKELNNNILMDTPKGKTSFACGAGFVLLWLHTHPDDWAKLYNDLYAFTQDYIAQS